MGFPILVRWHLYIESGLRSLMRQQWPKLRYHFLFYHDETKLMMNKQILPIWMFKIVPNCPWLQHGYMCTSGVMFQLHLINIGNKISIIILGKQIKINQNILIRWYLFTMVKVPHSKHTSVLLDSCHHYIDLCLFSKTFPKFRLKLTMELSNNQSSYKFNYSIEDYLLENGLKTNYHIQLFIFFICLFFHFDNVAVYLITSLNSKFLHFLWKLFSRVRHLSHQVGDMDPWPVTWLNSSDLIGWGQQISWLSTFFVLEIGD